MSPRIRVLSTTKCVSLCGLVAASLATSLLSAQAGYITMWESLGATRLGLDGAAGELLHEFPASALQGYGQSGGACRMTHVLVSLIDADPTTTEQYRVVVRRATATGHPDTSATGLLYRSTAQTFTARSPFAHVIEHTLSTFVSLPPSSTVFVGIEVPAAPKWPKDALFMDAELRPFGAAHSASPYLAWHVDRGKATRSAYHNALGVGLGSATPALVPSAVSGRLHEGMGGWFPSALPARSAAGLDLHLTDRNRAGAPAIFALSLGARRTAGIPLFPRGALWLTPTHVFVLGASTIDSLDQVRFRVVNVLPASTSGAVLSMQAYVLANGQIAASNEIAVRPF